MRVHAGFVPPRSALQELVEALESVAVHRESAVESAKGRRLGRSRRPESPTPSSSPLALDVLPLAEMQVPVAVFGNLTTGDARRLTAALTAAAADWARPRLFLSGAIASTGSGDRSVWVGLDGEVETLRTIAQGVPRCVERLGFYVDRRRFDPMIKVATVSSQPHAEELLHETFRALSSFQGGTWTLEALTVFTTSFAQSGPEFLELEQVALQVAPQSDPA